MKGRATLIALVDSLPADGTWTQAMRDRWLRAMATMVDLFVEVQEPVAREATDADR